MIFWVNAVYGGINFHCYVFLTCKITQCNGRYGKTEANVGNDDWKIYGTKWHKIIANLFEIYSLFRNKFTIFDGSKA